MPKNADYSKKSLRGQSWARIKQVAIDFGTDWGYCLAIVATLRLMLLLSICQPMSHLKQDRRTNPFMVECTQQVVSAV